MLCEKKECGDSVEQALLESFSQFGVSEALDWLRGFQITTVPRYAPLTRQQFETSSLHWSTSFHENKRYRGKLSNALSHSFQSHSSSFWSKFQQGRPRRDERIHVFCSSSGQGRKTSRKGAFAHYLIYIQDNATSFVPFKGFDGAVIVDPALGKILAVACDHSTGADPLQTAVMVCIDLVAQGQGGGVYNLGRECESTEPVLQRCTIDKLLFDVKWERSDLELVPRGKVKTKQPGSIIPYLCTGYDLYAAREPSVMYVDEKKHRRNQTCFFY